MIATVSLAVAPRSSVTCSVSVCTPTVRDTAGVAPEATIYVLNGLLPDRCGVYAEHALSPVLGSRGLSVGLRNSAGTSTGAKSWPVLPSIIWLGMCSR